MPLCARKLGEKKEKLNLSAKNIKSLIKEENSPKQSLSAEKYKRYQFKQGGGRGIATQSRTPKREGGTDKKKKGRLYDLKSGKGLHKYEEEGGGGIMGWWVCAFRLYAVLANSKVGR